MLKTQPWTVKNGKVRTLRGRWLTPRGLLLAVKRKILEDPRHYCQHASVVRRPKCGTVACIAGWACLLTTGKEESFVCTVGAFITGTGLNWPWLFDAEFDDGPEDLQDALAKARTARERSRVGADAISRFIKERAL